MAASPSQLVLLGCGGVGLALLKQVLRGQALAAEGKMGPIVEVAAVADSKHILVAGGAPFSAASLQGIIDAKSPGGGGLGSVAGAEARAVAEASAVIAALGAGCIVADCTAADTTALLIAAAEGGAGVVLANKKPVTAPMPDYKRLVGAGTRLRHESTVGAGTPVVTSVQRFARIGEPITSISGAFSGTLGYVMSGLQAGQAYSAVVTAAKDAGYTEPDPRDDLGGMDVARKALILARLLGWELEMKDVEVESLYPPELASVDVPAFMEGLPAVDEPMAARVKEAEAACCVLRYCATVEGGACKVGVKAVPIDSPLGRLQGTDNLVELTSECYSERPLVIQGAGAGAEITAAGVLSDVLSILD